MSDKLDLPFQFMRITAYSPELGKIRNMATNTDKMGIVLCTAGEIKAHIDSNKYELSKGDIYGFIPSYFVGIESVSSDFEAIAIQTDYGFIIPLINKIIDIRSQLLIRDNPCIALSPEESVNIKILMESLSDRIALENTSNFDARRKKIMRELIISMGTTLFYEVINIFFSHKNIEPIPQDRNDMVVQQFLISLYQNFHIQHNVAYYAQLQYLSPSYFSTVIKNKTGKSALQWIIEMVIVYAKQMLIHSNISIKELSVRLNFPSQTFFGKYFKQYVGMAPKDFRKKQIDV